jgi:hypothetical protein
MFLFAAQRFSYPHADQFWNFLFLGDKLTWSWKLPNCKSMKLEDSLCWLLSISSLSAFVSLSESTRLLLLPDLFSAIYPQFKLCNRFSMR